MMVCGTKLHGGCEWGCCLYCHVVGACDGLKIPIRPSGDFAAQTFQGRNVFTLDLARTLRSGVAGFCIHGPLYHLWIEWMEVNLVCTFPLHVGFGE